MVHSEAVRVLNDIPDTGTMPGRMNGVCHGNGKTCEFHRSADIHAASAEHNLPGVDTQTRQIRT